MMEMISLGEAVELSMVHRWRRRRCSCYIVGAGDDVDGTSRAGNNVDGSSLEPEMMVHRWSPRGWYIIGAEPETMSMVPSGRSVTKYDQKSEGIDAVACSR